MEDRQRALGARDGAASHLLNGSRGGLQPDEVAYVGGVVRQLGEGDHGPLNERGAILLMAEGPRALDEARQELDAPLPRDGADLVKQALPVLRFKPVDQAEAHR